VALRQCRRALARKGLAANLVAADLDVYRPPAEHFDLILVVRFLARSLIPCLKKALRNDGLVIYKSYNRNWLVRKPGFNPAFLLEPGELAAAFQDLYCIATNDTPGLQDPESFWFGCKR
jgi:hypothetical protein